MMFFARRDRFYLVEQGVEFFWTQLSIEVEAKEIIGEGDLRAHLQCLRKFVRRFSLILAQRVIEQGAERRGPELRHFAQAFELVAGGGVFLRVGGEDLQHREVELVNVVRRLLCDGGSKVAFFFRDVALRAGEPSGDHVVGRFRTILRRDPVEGVARDIELAETQGGRSHVQFARKPGIEPGDLRPPGDGLGAVLFFRGLGQDAEGSERFWIDGESFACHALGLTQVALLETSARRGEKTRFLPAVPALASRSESEKTEAKTKDDEERDD